MPFIPSLTIKCYRANKILACQVLLLSGVADGQLRGSKRFACPVTDDTYESELSFTPLPSWLNFH